MFIKGNRVPNLFSRGFVAIIALFTILIDPRPAQAQTYTWDPTVPVSGSLYNWFTGTSGDNWIGSSDPLSGASTTLIFGGTGTGYTALNNYVSPPFVLKQLQLNATITTNGSVYQISGGLLRFGGADNTISQTGTGAFVISNAIDLVHGLTVTGAIGTGLVSLDGLVSGTGGLTKTGFGSLALSNNSNSFTGGVTVGGGTLTVNSAGALGAASNYVYVLGNTSRGASLAFPGFGGGQLVIGGTSGLTIVQNMSISGGGPNGDGFAVNAVGNHTLSGNLNLGGGGTVRLASSFGSTSLPGTLTIAAGTTAQIAGNFNWSLNAPLAGGTNSIFLKAGAGTLILDASNNAAVNPFFGIINLNSGSTRVSSTAAFGGSSLVQFAGGTVEIRSDTLSGFDGSFNPFMTGNINVFVDNAVGGSALNQTVTFGLVTQLANTTTTLLGRNGYNVTYSDLTTTTGNPIPINNNSNGLLTLNGGVDNLIWNETNATGRLFTVGGNADSQISAGINAPSGGAHAFTKNGTGTLTITAPVASTYTGATTINQGMLVTASLADAFGTTSQLNIGNATTVSGALTYTGAGETFAKPVLLNATTANAYVNASGSGALVLSGSILGTVVGNKSLVLGGTSTAANEVTAAIPDTGTLSLAKIGGGTWILSGVNAYAGSTTVTGGTLRLKTTATNTTAGTSTIIPTAGAVVFGVDNATAPFLNSQFAGGTLEFNNTLATAATQSLGALSPSAGAATVLLTSSGGGAPNLTFASLGTVAVGTGLNFAIGGSGGAVTFATDPGNVNGIINPRLYFNGINFAATAAGVAGAASYTDSAVELTAGNTTPYRIAGDFTQTASVAVNAGLKFDSSNTITLDPGVTLTINNGANSAGGILVSGGVGATITGGTGLTTGGSGDLVVRANALSDTLTIASPLTVGTTGGLTKNGLGTLILSSSANAQTGATTINEGTIQLSGSGRLSGANAALVIRQGGTLDLNGVSTGTAIAAFNGAGIVTNSAASLATLTVGNNNGAGTFTGVLQDGGVSKPLALSKVGTGVISLTGANTFTGPVTVTSGILAATSLGNIGVASGLGVGDATSAATNAASLVFNGGTLQYTGSSTNTNAQIFQATQTPTVSIDRLFTLAANGAIDSSGSYGNNVIAAASQNNAALVLSNTSPLAFSGSTGGRTLTLTGTSISDNQIKIQLINNDSPSVGFNVLSVTKAGNGLWILGNTSNSYAGTTTISGGQLRANDGTTLPTASNLLFSGGVFETTGTFTRSIGSGAGQVGWSTNGNGGFSAGASKLTINLGGSGATLNWGAGGIGNGTGQLILNSTTALAEVEFINGIDLNGATRTITVNDNSTTATDFATISGVIADGSGSGSISKAGGGILQLTGLNIYTGVTQVTAGTLVVTSLGNSVSPSTGSSVGLPGGAVQLGNNSTGGANLWYVGPGEVSDRLIQIRTTTAAVTIDASGSGPLILTNTTNMNNLTAGVKTLTLTGVNNDTNYLASNLANNAVGNALTVSKTGSGNWVLAGVSSFTGGVSLTAGALGVGNNEALGTGTLTFASGTLFGHGGDRTLNNAVTNNGEAAFSGSHSLTFNGTLLASIGGNRTITNAITGPATLTFSGTINLSDATARATTLAGPGTTVFNNVINNGGNTSTLSLNALGGTVQFNSGVNTYSGTTTLTAGTLVLNGSGATPLGTGATFALNGGTLRVNVPLTIAQNTTLATTGQGPTIAGSSNLTFSGTFGNVAGNETLTNNLTGGALTLSGLFNLSTATDVTARTWTFAGTGDTALTGTLQTTTVGAHALAYNSSGSLSIALTAPSATLGNFQINNGTVLLNSVGGAPLQFGSTAATGTFVNSGGTLTLDNQTNGNPTTANRLGGKNLFLAGGTLNFTANIAVGSSEAVGILTLNNGGSTLSFNNAGSMNSTLSFTSLTATAAGGSLNVTGTGVAALGTTNQITFGTAPTLTPTAGGILARITVTNGSNFDFATYDSGLIAYSGYVDATAPGLANLANIDTASLTATPAVTLAASKTINGLKLVGTGIVVDAAAAATLTVTSGGVLVTGATTGNTISAPIVTLGAEGLFHINTGSTLTVSSVITGSAGLTKADGGTLNLQGSLAYLTGAINVNEGTLKLGAKLPYQTTTSVPTVQALNINKPGTIDLNGINQAVGAISSASPVAGNGGTIDNTSATPLNLISSSGTTSTTFAGVIQNSGGGAISLYKQGNSTLTLTGANTYTGSTTLFSGGLTLRESGSIASTFFNVSGVLTLDNGGSGGAQVVANRIPASAAINLRGGTVTFVGGTAIMDETTIGAGSGYVEAAYGANTLTATIGTGGSAYLTIGNLVRAASGGTVNFTGSGTLGQPTSANGRIILTQINGVASTDGWIGAWAITNSTDFTAYRVGQNGTVSGVGAYNTTGMPAYATQTLNGAATPASSLIFATGNVVNLTGSAGSTVLLPAGVTTADALRISGNVANLGVEFTGATDVLNLRLGGLLRDNSNQATSIGTILLPGVLTAGTSASTTTELIVFNQANNAANTFTINAVITDTKDTAVGGTGVVRLMKSGAGVLSLTAANSYSGGTVVQQGTLSLNGLSSTMVIPAGGLTINNGATVTMVTNSGQIAPASAVTLNGAGVLTMVGDNTLSSLTFNNNSGSVAVTPTVTPGASGATLTLSAANAIMVINDSLSTTPTIGGTGNLAFTAANATVTVSGLSTDGLIISSIITGVNGTLVKAGPGSLVLTAANTFTGNVRLDAGSIIASGAGSFGAGNQVVFNAAGTSLVPQNTTASTFTFGLDVTAADGTVVVNRATIGAGVVHVLNGSNTIGTRTLTMSPGELVNVNSPYGLTLSGTTSVADNSSFVTNNSGIGLGTLTLSGALNFSGASTLTHSGSGSMTVSGTTTLAGATTFVNNSSNLLTVGAIVANGNVITVNGTGSQTYSGVISEGVGGVASIVVSGAAAAVVTFSGASTFTGGVNLNSAETAIATAAGGFGISAPVTFNASGSNFILQNSTATTFLVGLRADGFNGLVTINRAAVGSGVTHAMSGFSTIGTQTLTIQPGSFVSADTAYGLNLSGTTLITGSPTFVQAVNGTADGTQTISGPINFAGQSTVTQSGPGVLTMSGTSTLSGATTFVNNSSNLLTVGAVAAGSNTITFNAALGNITAGTLTFATPAALTNLNAVGTTSVGAIALLGASNLTVTNNSTMLLTTGAITTTGAANPALEFAGTGSTTTGNITFSTPATVLVGGSGTVTLGTVTASGNGTTTFSNNNANLAAFTLATGTNAVKLGGTAATTLTQLTMSNNSYFESTGSGGLTITTLNQGGGNNYYANAGTAAVTLVSNGSGAQHMAFVGGGAFEVTGTFTVNNSTQLGYTAYGATTLTFTNTSIINLTGSGGAAFINYSSSPITVNSLFNGNNRPIRFDGPGDAVVNSDITGSNTSGSVLANGFGNVTLNGTNTVGGGVTAANGTLVLAGSNTFNAVTLNAGGTIQFAVSDRLGGDGITAPSVTLAGGTLSLTAAPGVATNYTPGNGTTAGATTVSASSTINVTSPNATLNFAGNLSLGAFTLSTTGAGNVTFAGTTSLTNANNTTASFLNNGTGTLTIAAMTSPNAGVLNNNLALSGTGNIVLQGTITQGTNVTQLVQINGNGGSNSGAGTVMFNSNASTYTGANTINAGTLIITPGSGGVGQGPLGAATASNTLTINSGSLQVNPTGSPQTTPIGPLATGGGATITVAATAAAGANQTTLTFANASAFAPAAGTALIINTGAGSLGTNVTDDVVISFPTGAPAVLNSIVVPSIVGQLSGGTTATFLTYSGTGPGSGFAPATYTGPLADGGANSNISQTSGVALTAPTLAYALQVNAGTVSGATTLTIGSGANAGLILNGASSIATTTLAFAAAIPAIYVNGNASIAANITGSNGLNVFGPGTLSLTGGGSNITGGTISINNATLVVDDTNDLGNRPITLRGTLNISPTAVFTNTSAITVGAGGGTLNVASGSDVILGNPSNGITLGINTPLTIATTSGTNLELNGVIATAASAVTFTGAGNVAITRSYSTTTGGVTGLVLDAGYAGAVTLNNAAAAGNPNTGVVVNGGTLVLQAGSSFAAANVLAVNGGMVKFNSTGNATNGQVLNAVTLNAGTLDSNGFNSTIGGIAGGTGAAGSGGTLTNSSTTSAATLTIRLTSAANVNFGGTLADTASDSNGGAGTLNIVVTGAAGNNRSLTLAGANTLHGTLTVAANPNNNSHALFIGNSFALQNATLVDNAVTGTTGVGFSTGATNGTGSYGLTTATVGGLAGYGNFVLPTTYFNASIGNNNLNTTFAGVISGGQASQVTLTKIDTGTLSLGNQSTFAGIVAVSSGSVLTAAPNALFGTGGGTPGNTVSVASNATLDTYSLDQIALSLTGSGTVATGNYPNNVLSLTGTVNNAFAGGITGGSSVTKANTNTQILTGVGLNTYSGTTTVTAGTLQALFPATGGANVLSPNSPVSLNGGTLNITAGANVGSTSNQSIVSLSTAQATNGQLTLANTVSGATLNVTFGTLTRGVGSMLTITTPTHFPVTIGGTTNLMYSGGMPGGILTDANGSAFATVNNFDWAAKDLTNTKIVGGATVAGFYTVNALGTSGTNTDFINNIGNLSGTTGSIRFNTNTAVTATLTGNMTLASGGILVTPTTVNNAQTIAGAGFNIIGPVAAGADFVIVQNGGGTFTIGANLVNGTGGGTGLTKGGTGILVLTGGNTYSGPTTILTGTLTFGTGGAAPAAMPTGNFINNSTLTINTNSGTVTVVGDISGNGVITNTNGNTVLNGVITGTGTLTVTAGSATLGNSNPRTGGITVSAAGSLVLTNSLAAQNSTLTATANNGLVFGGGLTAFTLGGLAGAGTGQALVNDTSAAVALTVGNNNAATSFSGTLTGPGSVMKIGTGALTFNPAANTGSSYTGDTTVTQGGLTLTFAAAGSTASVLYNGVTPGNLVLGGTVASPINASSLSTQAAVTITASTTTATTSAQAFDATTLAANSNNSLTLTNGTAGANLNVDLGAFTRSVPGGTGNPNTNTGSFLGISTIATTGTTTLATSTGVTNNVLTDTAGTAFATIGNLDWASKSGGNIVALASYTNNAFGAGVNANVTGSFAVPGGTNNVNTIRLIGAAGNVTLASGLTTITTGGVMVGAGAAGNLGILGGAGTSLTSGSGEFMFVTNVGRTIVIGAAGTPTGTQLVDRDINTPTALTLAGSTSNTLQINSLPTYTGPTFIGIGTLQLQFNGTASFPTSAIYNNGALQFNSAAGASNIITVNGVISGTGSVTQNNGGTTILGAANTYTGTTVINAGMLKLATADALPNVTAMSMTGTPAAVGTTLDLNGFNTAVGSLSGNLAVGATVGAVIKNGTSSATLTVGSLNTTTTFFGTLTDGGGTLGLTKVGTGMLTLTGLNDYTGTTTVIGGVLNVAATGSLGTGPLVVSNPNTVVGTGVVLTVSPEAQTVGSLSGTVATPTTGINYAQINLGPNSLLTVNQTTDGDFAGNITGASGSLALGASSTSTLSLHTNYYGGATTIRAGTLSADLLSQGGTPSSVGASSNSAANLVLNGGNLKYVGAATSTDRLFTLGGSATIDASGTGAVNFTNSGTVLIPGSAARTLTLDGSNAGANTLAAVMGDPSSNTTSLTKTGAGLWILTGANTFSGTTYVEVGVLRIGGQPTLAGVLSNGTNATPLSLNNVVGTTFDLNNFNVTARSLSGGGASGGNITTGTGVGGTLTLKDTIGGTASYDGIISGVGGLTLAPANTGTQILTGASTYSGPTTVNGGTLKVNGSLTAASGTVTVSAGATIGGTGTVGGALNIQAGGILSPGNSPGLLTVNNALTMSTGAHFVWEITNGQVINPVFAFNTGGSDTGSQDKLLTTGGVGSTITAGAIVVDILQVGSGSLVLDPQQNYSFTLMAAPAGAMATIDIASTFTAGALTSPDFKNYVDNGGGISFAASDNVVYMNLTAVPEPATVGFIAVAGFGVGAFFRRRVRRLKDLAA